MNTITIIVSDATCVDSEIQKLENCIPEASKRTPEFQLVYSQAKLCIEDFSEKARKLAAYGTTIHIKKQFSLPGVSIVVLLQYPRKIGPWQRIVRVIKRVFS